VGVGVGGGSVGEGWGELPFVVGWWICIAGVVSWCVFASLLLKKSVMVLCPVLFPCCLGGGSAVLVASCCGGGEASGLCPWGGGSSGVWEWGIWCWCTCVVGVGGMVVWVRFTMGVWVLVQMGSSLHATNRVVSMQDDGEFRMVYMYP
jgi:hypothetical protein